MNLEQQQNVADIGSGVSTVAASSALLGWLNNMNEILIFVATIIAIVSGSISIYEKWKLISTRRKVKKELK